MSDNRLNIPKMEEDVLKFWKENNIFEKSIEIREGAPDFVFYDGPPFANGLPHNGHILSSVSKDLVGRYKTMRGFRVERRWGWDCHGLPVENAIEKELGLNGRKEIEEFGIDKFNNACEVSVMKYDKEWERQVERWGRFVDFKRNYKTMDKNFMESVWWGFKQLFDKGYVYEDTRISLYCPRCETPLSNFEIAMDNSYKKVTDPSIYVKFKLEGKENEYLLIWTTTPWTLPSNSAVAVHPRLEYCKVKVGGEFYWVAMSLVDTIFGDVEHEASDCHKGEELIGWKYLPVFDYFKPTKKNTYTVVAGEFVTTTDGTGMVHIAPTFGDDDFKIGKEYDLDFIESVNQQGKFTDLVSKFAGKNVWNINQNVLEYLKEAGVVYKVLPITHEYPFCYRCDTKLIYKTQPAWYIKVSAFKDKMLKANEQIKWHPEHLQKGRFGHGLETAPDWNVSRSRFWGNAIPVWKHTKTGGLKVFGSIKELEEVSGMKVENLHRPEIDKVTWKDGDGSYVRVGEVFDCWFESGSMPWASVHYPFENKEWFEKNYPAEFISEYIAQTRGWFYTMHVLAVGIFDKPSFIHAVTTGTILAKDGQKMSKSKKNYTDPMELINKYGVDSMRYYLMSSPLMNAENLNYKDEEHADAFRKINLLTWNVYTFFATYSNLLKSKELVVSDNLLDKWILSRLNLTVKEITESYDNYDITRGTREIGSFIDELSTWYLRRSRDRFKNDKDEKDQQAVLNTMYNVLLTLSKLLAPVAPFMAEELYQKLGGVKQSVHLDEWPKFDPTAVDSQVLNDMETARLLIEKSLAIRSTNGVKIRQALGILYINKVSLPKEYHEIIADEVNVKEVMATKDLPAETDMIKVNADENTKVALDLTITEELRKEGDFRELTRAINNHRKELKLTPNDIVSLAYETDSNELSELINQMSDQLKEATRLKEIVKDSTGEMVEVEINGKNLKIRIIV